MKLENKLWQRTKDSLKVLGVGATLYLTNPACSDKSPTEPEVRDPNYVQLSENTFSQNELSQNLYSVDNQKLIFSERNAVLDSVEIGDVLLPPPSEKLPYGFIGKVEYISPNRDTLITKKVPLQEGVDFCDASFSKNLSSDMIIGSNFKKNVSYRSLSANGFDHSIIIDNYVLDDVDGNSITQDDKFVINGRVDFSADLEGDIKMNKTSLDKLLLKATFENNANIYLGLSNSSLDFDVEHKLGEMYFGPIMIGGVIPLTPVVGAYVGMKGNVTGMEVGFSQNAQFDIGFNYENEVFNEINSFTNNFDVDSASASSNANAKAYISLRLEALVAGSLGGYLNEEVYARADLDMSRNPILLAYLGNETSVGAKVDVFFYNLFEKDKVIQGSESEIFRSKNRGIMDPQASLVVENPWYCGYVSQIWKYQGGGQTFEISQDGTLNSIDIKVSPSEYGQNFSWHLKNAENIDYDNLEISTLPIIAQGESYAPKKLDTVQNVCDGAKWINVFEGRNIPVKKDDKYFLEIKGSLNATNYQEEILWLTFPNPGDSIYGDSFVGFYYDPIMGEHWGVNENREFDGARKVWITPTK